MSNVRLTIAEATALVTVLIRHIGADVAMAALAEAIGSQRAFDMAAKQGGRISKDETAAFVRAVAKRLPGDKLADKLTAALAMFRSAIPDRDRANAILAYILERLKAYAQGPAIPPTGSGQFVEDGFLRLYGRVNAWCYAGESILRKDLDVCAEARVGYQIEMGGWMPGTTAFDSTDNLVNTTAMYGQLVGWCVAAKIPLFVSITNWNITKSKHGNKARPFSSILSAAKTLAQTVHDCGGKDFVYVQPVAETGDDATAKGFEKWCGELFAGWKLVYNGGSRPTKPAYGWPHFAYHPNSASDGGAKGGISISDTQGIIKGLAADGTMDGPGHPDKIRAWFDRCKAAKAIGAGYYAFGRVEHDPEAIRACGVKNASSAPSKPSADGWPAELKDVKWLHTNIRDWPATATITDAGFTKDKVFFRYDKANVWPVSKTGVSKGSVANVWAIVKVDGIWHSATFEWLKPGQTDKHIGTLNHTGGKGDHFKVKPLSAWTLKKGDSIYLMVSGHARGGARNIAERSNPVKVTYK